MIALVIVAAVVAVNVLVLLVAAVAKGGPSTADVYGDLDAEWVASCRAESQRIHPSNRRPS